MDWSTLTENGRAFQSMALDLFGDAHEDGFTPGPLHRGPDGAWDGQYEGKLVGVRGIWKIACAAYKDFASLKRKVKHENETARRDRADALLIMTPLDLTAPQVRELQKLANVKLKKGLVWARSKLQRMIDRNPYVAAGHFNVPFVPGFAPPNTPEFILEKQPDIPLQGRQDELDTISQVLGGPARVLVISGPGGSGKSRLLREIPRLVKRIPRATRPSVWVRRNGAGSIDDALKTALPKGRPLVLCLDDAGQDLDDARALGRLASQPRGNFDVKAILVCRSADLFQVESVCRKVGFSFERIALTPISKAAARAVVRSESAMLPEQIMDPLVRAFGRNLFLLRAATRLILGGESPSKVLDDGYLRGELAGRFIAECQSVLAQTAPASDARATVLSAALSTPLSESQVNSTSAWNTMRRAGLLRRIGRRIRFRTDVEGDLVLRELCREPWVQVQVEEFLNANNEMRDNALRNLAAAGGEEAGKIIEENCARWVSEVGNTVCAERRRRLTLAKYLVRYAPDEVAQLCRGYITTSAPPSTDSITFRFGEMPPRADDFGPVLISLARHGHIEDVLDLVYQMSLAQIRNGRFGNYKPATIVQESLNPAHAAPDAHERVIAWLSRRLGEPSNEAIQAELLTAVLGCLLAESFSWTSSSGRQFTIHEQSFAPTKSIVQMRDCAIALVTQALGHDHPAIRLTGARTIKQLGWGDGGRVSTAAMKPRVADEVSRLLSVVEERLPIETDMQVLHELYDGLVQRWAAQCPGAEKAGELMRGFSRPVLLQAYQLADAPWDWIANMEAILAAPPDQNRWHWWLRDREQASAEEVEAFVAELRAAYTGVDGLITVASAVLKAHRCDYVLDPWCRSEPTLFTDAIAGVDDGPVRVLLHEAYERVTVKSSGEAAYHRVTELVATNDRKGLRRVAQHLSGLPMNDLYRVVEVLVKHESIELRRLGLSLVEHRREIDEDVIADFLVLALRDGDWRDVWKVIWGCFRHEGLRNSLSDRSDLLTAVQRASVESLTAGEYWKRNENDWWYFTELVEQLDQAMPGLLDNILAQAVSPASLGGVAHLMGGLIDNEAGLRHLVGLCRQWLEDGKLGGARDIGDLVEAALIERSFSPKRQRADLLPPQRADLLPPQRADLLPPEALAVASDALGANDIHERKAGLGLLAEIRSSPEACQTIVELAMRDGELREEAKWLLSRFSRPRGSYVGGGDGQPPPVYLDIEQVLAQAEKLASPEARAVLSQMKAGVQQSIKRDLEQDEEHMNPRS